MSFTAVRVLGLRVCSPKQLVVLNSKYTVFQASVVQDCNNNFPATLNQSFTDSNKVWGLHEFHAVIADDDTWLATRYAKYLVTAARQGLVSNYFATSMWTTLAVRQVKRQHQFFKLSRMNFTSLQWVQSSSRGRSAIGVRNGLVVLVQAFDRSRLDFS